jgi:hypothetical protein
MQRCFGHLAGDTGELEDAGLGHNDSLLIQR